MSLRSVKMTSTNDEPPEYEYSKVGPGDPLPTLEMDPAFSRVSERRKQLQADLATTKAAARQSWATMQLANSASAEVRARALISGAAVDEIRTAREEHDR